MHISKRGLVGTIAALTVTGMLGSPSAWAAPATESGDAGDLPATAQVLSGSGSIDSITGDFGASLDVDMYQICLTGGKTFSASTAGISEKDPQLFLFDADGVGVETNDDTGIPANGLNATLPAGGLSPQDPGVYYLAISKFNHDARDADGNLIFPSTFPGVFGPYDADPVASWDGAAGAITGDYTITLTGARFCDQAVEIDVKPGSETNPINLKSKGVVPVAVLTTADFDAATIDVSSACLEDDCTESHGTGHPEDVDGDGDMDLVLHFNTQELGLAAGDTEACFTATTTYGEVASGCDSITIVP